MRLRTKAFIILDILYTTGTCKGVELGWTFLYSSHYFLSTTTYPSTPACAACRMRRMYFEATEAVGSRL